MFLQIKEIEKLLGNFEGENQEELSRYYIEVALQRLKDLNQFNYKKLELLKSILKYSNVKNHKKLIDEILSIKIIQIRALILDLITTNYSMEQQYIYKPEKWMESIINDLFKTFNISERQTENLSLNQSEKYADGESKSKKNQKLKKEYKLDLDLQTIDILNLYNKKLCEEIILIFCSCEKFNSAGNQLILNIVMYIKTVGKYLDYDYSDFIKKLYSRFNPDKAVPLIKIENIYDEYLISINKKSPSLKK